MLAYMVSPPRPSRTERRVPQHTDERQTRVCRSRLDAACKAVT